jgi:hypothetical protein
MLMLAHFFLSFFDDAAHPDPLSSTYPFVIGTQLEKHGKDIISLFFLPGQAKF